MLKYAGIGARETPTDVLAIMGSIAKSLTEEGWMLRTGGAKGADSAFAENALPELREIHIPWDGYNGHFIRDIDTIMPKLTDEIEHLTASHHDAWNALRKDRVTPVLSDAVRKFMFRNTTIVAGEHLTDRVQMIICWTPGGEIVGGTGHALRLAKTLGVRVFNLARPGDWDPMCEYAEFLTKESRK